MDDPTPLTFVPRACFLRADRTEFPNLTTVSFAATQTDVLESDGVAQVSLLNEGDLNGTVVVNYVTGNDTAVAGADYVGTTGSVTFGPGETLKVLSIPVLDDGLSEGNESFSVSIPSVVGGTIGFPRTTRVVIEDDEAPSEGAAPDTTDLLVRAESVYVGGLTAPIAFDWVPGQPGTLVIGEKSGLIRVARDGAVLETPLLDLRAIVNDVQDRGLLDVELHPQFPTQPYLYAYVTVDPPDTAANEAGSNAGPDGAGNRYVQLLRYTVDTVEGQLRVNPDSAVVLLGGAGNSLQDISGNGAIDSTNDLALPPSGIRPDGSNVEDYIAADSLSHAAGDMEFGPDGALYVSVGDGTSFNFADPRSVRVQDLGNLSGKVLRVDPLTGDGLPDNPFFVADAPDSNQSKVYQLGVRNAFRMAFDGEGDLFLGDVGWYSWEEINTGGPGANFGWPFYEGGQNGVSLRAPQYQDFPQAQAFYAAGTPVTAPFQAFSHLDSNTGFALQAIVLGDVYTGALYPGVLQNDLFFASLTTNQVFTIDTNDPARTVSLVASQDATIVSIAQGPDGAFYYANIAGGAIGRWQILAASSPVLSQFTVGTGPDALVLQIQQDAYRGNAQYTVSIDGVQVGGVLTATGTRATGQFDTVVVRADLAPGEHDVAIDFLEDAYGGSPDTDRNLFVGSATYNGATVADATRALFSAGQANFAFTEVVTPQPLPLQPPPGSATAATIGAGPDTLLLGISQDAYQGNAQYTVSVDGVQVGGILTASAPRGSGQFDAVNVLGDFAPGNHDVVVNFLNDLYAGTADTDRNLSVESATYNGAAVNGAGLALYSQGPAGFGFVDAAKPSAGPGPAVATIGAGPDTLALRLSQDAYLGDAQYTVSIDGVQVGGILTASAPRGSGQFDVVNVLGDFAPGNHDVLINFLNDAYAGTADTDRNLYVESATYNGAAVNGAGQILYVGSGSFGFTEMNPLG